ncbi:hypothetical protein AVL62_13135 [Serinicoccus chungangensis]|uniref:Uncharacterized protein n=1 Tax=Serinicoccus chungangensis TaxID=767452 RepID=A0A0W8IBP3_9MICO|nr:hypothetical protein AVL62_13135 [Serinicoccus chungangensis]
MFQAVPDGPFESFRFLNQRDKRCGVGLATSQPSKLRQLRGMSLMASHNEADLMFDVLTQVVR